MQAFTRAPQSKGPTVLADGRHTKHVCSEDARLDWNCVEIVLSFIAVVFNWGFVAWEKQTPL